MEKINQISYAIFLFFAMAIFLKSVFEVKHLKITPDQKHYWLNSILAFIVSNLGFFIASFGWPLVLIVSNIALMFCLINVCLLFRAMRQPITKQIRHLWFGVLLGYFVLYIGLFGLPYGYRYLLISISIFICTFLQINELTKLIKNEPSIHLRLIMLLLLGLLVLVCWRLLNMQESFNIMYVYQEGPWGLIGRVIMTLIYFSFFILVSSYFYEKLLLSESHAVNQLNAKVLELQQVTTEKDQVKSLLEEREQLLSSLVKAEKMVETSVLSASIAHELSQPLCAIKINTQSMRLLMLEETDPLITQAVTRINNNVDRAVGIIGSLKQIFTEQARKDEKICMDNLVESMGVIFKTNARIKGIELNYQLNAPKPIPIEVSEFQQVIINLLNNAINAFEGADIKDKQITIRTKQSDLSTIVEVVDNGVGISDAIGESIFDLMRTTTSTGMGIGLWLSRYIVERHGGTLVYENQPEAGVAFVIYLPMI